MSHRPEPRASTLADCGHALQLLHTDRRRCGAQSVLGGVQAHSIDDPRWQTSIIETVKRHGIRVVAFDPLRSMTAHADQGPAELVPVVDFVRRLQREACCAVLLGHHDTKPSGRRGENPDLPQRASGGGLFGIADTPIHLRRRGDKPFRSVLTPSQCKYFDAPTSIPFTLHVGKSGYVVVGDETGETAEEVERREQERIVQFLDEHPGASASKVQAATGRQNSATLDRLRLLAVNRRIENRGKGRRHAWYVVQQPKDGSGGSIGSRTITIGGSMVPLLVEEGTRTDPPTGRD